MILSLFWMGMMHRTPTLFLTTAGYAQDRPWYWCHLSLGISQDNEADQRGHRRLRLFLPYCVANEILSIIMAEKQWMIAGESTTFHGKFPFDRFVYEWVIVFLVWLWMEYREIDALDLLASF
jgi:hypothetical protein